LLGQVSIIEITEINRIELFHCSDAIIVTVVPRALDVIPELPRLAAVVIQNKVFIIENHKVFELVFLVCKCGMVDIQVCEFVPGPNKVLVAVARLGGPQREAFHNVFWLYHVAARPEQHVLYLDLSEIVTHVEHSAQIEVVGRPHVLVEVDHEEPSGLVVLQARQYVVRVHVALSPEVSTPLGIEQRYNVCVNVRLQYLHERVGALVVNQVKMLYTVEQVMLEPLLHAV